jgi:acetylornithine deacetylase
MPKSMTTVEMLKELVAFDTTSRNSNLELIQFAQDYLAAFGVDSQRVDFEPGKANLVAVIGPRAPGGLVLSGHTDVVPVDGQDWSSDPFTLRVERSEGKVYGRGTCDMKGYLAAALALVPEFLERDLKRPVILAFSCDEEVGCTGVRPMIEWMKDNLEPVEAVFVGEPTGMNVVTAHKGIEVMRTTVHGHPAHSSCTHLGVNAIMAAGEVIAEINRIAREEMDKADPDSGFVPPYTTVNIGLVNGGTAKNIIPEHCAIDWETRLMPEAQAGVIPQRVREFARRHVEPGMKKVSDKAGVTTEVVNAVPGLAHADDSPAARLAMRFAGANGCYRASYGTEAGLFQRAGMPAVICGPGHIEQAHKPDEYVAIDQLNACEAYLRNLADWCARREG